MVNVTIEPHVEVYDVPATVSTTYGVAGKVAVIGAFPSATFSIGVFTSLESAIAEILDGTDYKDPSDVDPAHASKTDVPATYKAYYALPYAFTSNRSNGGAESVLIVNTQYGASSLSPTTDNTTLLAATKVLADEDFDILSVAEPIVIGVTSNDSTILNPMFSTLKTFVNTQFKDQKPFGLITGVDMTNATTSLMTDFKNMFNDKGIYKAVTTKVKLNGANTSLPIEASGLWHAAYTAGKDVGYSETAKLYEGTIGENSKDVYPSSASVNYANMREKGFHTTRFRNRRLQTVECTSGLTPAGYDMKVERVKNYIIKRLTVANYLGLDHTRRTLEDVISLFEYEKGLAVDMGYIFDMEYDFESVDSQTLKAQIKLYIPEIIRVVELDVALKVTDYSEFEEGGE